MNKLWLISILLMLVLCSCSQKRTIAPPPPPTPELLIAPRPTEDISIEEMHERKWKAIYATAQEDSEIRTATAEAAYWLTPHTPTNIYSPTPDPVQNCRIKGSKNMIYHCKNSPNFSTMTDYTCFSSPAEAEKHGYRMSQNVGWCQY